MLKGWFKEQAENITCLRMWSWLEEEDKGEQKVESNWKTYFASQSNYEARAQSHSFKSWHCEVFNKGNMARICDVPWLSHAFPKFAIWYANEFSRSSEHTFRCIIISSGLTLQSEQPQGLNKAKRLLVSVCVGSTEQDGHVRGAWDWSRDPVSDWCAPGAQPGRSEPRQNSLSRSSTSLSIIWLGPLKPNPLTDAAPVALGCVMKQLSIVASRCNLRCSPRADPKSGWGGRGLPYEAYGRQRL